ncbi:MAG: hypothetical protein WC356_02160 [Candidatus Micrarchaeia archaeon]|jgi:hypothetical protein
MTDFDDDSGWLVNEPVNPFALDKDETGEEVGYKKVHAQLCDVVEKFHNFVINKSE